MSPSLKSIIVSIIICVFILPNLASARTIDFEHGYNFFGAGTTVTEQQLQEAGCDLLGFGRGTDGRDWKDYNVSKLIFAIDPGRMSDKFDKVRYMTDVADKPWQAYLIFVQNESGCSITVENEQPITQLTLKNGYNAFALSAEWDGLTQSYMESQGCDLLSFGDGGFKWEVYSLANKVFTIDWGMHPDGISEKFRRMVNVIEPYKAFLVYNDGAECTFGMCEGEECRQPISTPTGKVTTVGNKIVDAAGEDLLLVGGNLVGLDIDYSTAMSDRVVKESKLEKISNAGANFVSILVNSELWNKYPEYRTRIDEIVGWCRKYDLYYRIQNFQVGSDANSIPELFCHAGSNFRLTETEPYRSNSIRMWEGMIDRYGDDPNFVGFGLMNEPVNNDWGYQKWDTVVQYYYDCIDAVTARPKGEGTIFMVMEPIGWGSWHDSWGTVRDGKMRDFIDYPHIVYEFHNYHWNRRYSDAAGKGWAYEYEQGDLDQGWEDLMYFHKKFILLDSRSTRTDSNEIDYPVYCGEYSMGETPNQFLNGARAVTDQMKQMNQLGISHSFHSMQNAVSGNRHPLFNSEGTDFNAVGEIWAENVPQNLRRPSDAAENDFEPDGEGEIWFYMTNDMSQFQVSGGTIQHNPPDSRISEMSFDGKSWLKSEIINPDVSYTGSSVTRAQALKWHGIGGYEFDEEPSAYFGVWIYLPEGFEVPTEEGVNNWCLIFQAHQNGGGYEADNKIALTVKRSGEFNIGWSHHSDSRDIGLIDGIYGRPFKVILHASHSTMEGWIDGQYIGSMSGDFDPLQWGAESNGWFWSTGLYQNVGSNSKYMLFRDGAVGSTFEAVNGYLDAKM